MKEKIFKKGIGGRLFSTLLTLAMVFSLIPANSITSYASTTPTPLTFTAEEAGAMMSFSWADGSDVQIKPGSTDIWVDGAPVPDTEWQSYTAGKTIILANQGDFVQFKGTNVTTEYGMSFIINDKPISASGDVTSLTNGEGGDIALTANSYKCMFHSCTQLVSAPNLPSTTLANYCYDGMFFGCTGLESAPELPATNLENYCYHSMFYGCTGLESAPELPAKNLAENCYYEMFSECTGLINAPELPATELADSCYDAMFYECTGLESAPELPATTLAEYCYSSMFSGCTGLIDAPELPATELAADCYGGMFYGCEGLIHAPELPAKILVDGCYEDMFTACTNLTSVPELKPTTLAEDCFAYMFEGCGNLIVEETADASEAIWVFPSDETDADDWNEDMIYGANALSTVTGDPEAGKMYKVTPAEAYHSHKWKYLATDNKLEAYCANPYCTSGTSASNKVSLTLLATSQTHTGNAVEASISSAETAAWEEAGFTVPEIKYFGREGTTDPANNAAPTAIGKYTAKITYDNKVFATIDFEITKPNSGENDGGKVAIHRYLRPDQKDWLITCNEKEIENLIAAGWKDEGALGFAGTKDTGVEVIRFYNEITGDRMYTSNEKEKQNYRDAKKYGWIEEGVAFYTGNKAKIVRYTTPNLSHIWSVSIEEQSRLDAHESEGWKKEGVAFYLN